MARINLLPHRAARRKRKVARFFALLILSAALGLALVLAVGAYNARGLARQEARNQLLKDANADLDRRIGEVAALKRDIAALAARQQAVEDLQGERNHPAHLMDELARQTPDGMYWMSFRQDGARIHLSGYAQSQERVSALLHNLAEESPRLAKPELIEVRAADKGAAHQGMEFSLTVELRSGSGRDAGTAGAGARPRAPGASE